MFFSLLFRQIPFLPNAYSSGFRRRVRRSAADPQRRRFFLYKIPPMYPKLRSPHGDIFALENRRDKINTNTLHYSKLPRPNYRSGAVLCQTRQKKRAEIKKTIDLAKKILYYIIITLKDAAITDGMPQRRAQMKIDSVNIQSYIASTYECSEEGLYHCKSLPTLSVVQTLDGEYEFGFEKDKLKRYSKLEAFIAPGGRTQHIVHHLNPETHHFSGQYVFADIIVNNNYKLEDLFELPDSIPSKYGFEIFELIRYLLANAENICGCYSRLYRLAEILLSISSQKESADPLITELRAYVGKNYAKRITAQTISEQFAVSVPTVFRKFKAGFGMTPANYINSVRLAQAAVMLEMTQKPAGSIGYEVGFEDVFYFSKLFKQKYGVAPTMYRERMQDTRK